mgnify:CR=1 FL=1
MELSTFKIAEEINCKKEDLKEQLKSLNHGSWSLKTGYAEMGRDLTTTVEFKKDISVEICAAIKNIIDRHIDALDKEFKEL